MKKYLSGIVISDADRDVYDWFKIPSISPSLVRDFLNEAREKKEPIELVISSGGGNVIAGSEIYTELRTYEGEVTLRIVYAASAASVIAMARHTVAEPTAMIMIHNSSTRSEGDYHEMEKTAETLKTVNSAMSNAYAEKTGMSRDEILDLMDKETWLDAQKALELGFIDEIDTAEKRLAASLGGQLSEAEIKNARKAMARAEAEKRLADLRRTL